MDEQQKKDFEAYCAKHGFDPTQFKNVNLSADGRGWNATFSVQEFHRLREAKIICDVDH